MARNDGIDRTVARNQDVETADDLAKVQEHNEREKDSYSNEDIEPERSSLNVHFKAPTAGYAEMFEQMEQDKVISTRGLKADAVKYHQAQLEELKSTRRNLQDLRLEVENSIRSGERALEVYDPDSMDYQFACTRLHTLHLAAKESRIAVRMKLVEALGSVESAETLLQEVGISSDIIDEEAIKSQLMPPTIPSAAVLHSYDASQTAEADRFSIAS